MRRIWFAVGLGLLLFTLGAAAFQWSTDKKDKPRDRSHRDVAGLVMLEDETPVGGAVVKLKNLRTLQIRSFITQTDGKYVFQNLSSSVDFELKAEYKGMASATRSLTIYDTRLDPVINLKLEPAKK
jgi:hypothetical protein